MIISFEFTHEILVTRKPIEIFKCDHSNYGHYLALYTCMFTFHKVVLNFESVGEIPKCDHSNESY